LAFDFQLNASQKLVSESGPWRALATLPGAWRAPLVCSGEGQAGAVNHWGRRKSCIGRVSFGWRLKEPPAAEPLGEELRPPRRGALEGVGGCWRARLACPANTQAMFAVAMFCSQAKLLAPTDNLDYKRAHSAAPIKSA